MERSKEAVNHFQAKHGVKPEYNNGTALAMLRVSGSMQVGSSC